MSTATFYIMPYTLLNKWFHYSKNRSPRRMSRSWSEKFCSSYFGNYFHYSFTTTYHSNFDFFLPISTVHVTCTVLLSSNLGSLVYLFFQCGSNANFSFLYQRSFLCIKKSFTISMDIQSAFDFLLLWCWNIVYLESIVIFSATLFLSLIKR